MAGGTFKPSQPKVRPGVYVNVKNGRAPEAVEAASGICMIPLLGYDYGPKGEWIHLTAESPDAEKTKLGRSIYDDNMSMRMIALAFQNATEVYVGICNTGGKEASGKIGEVTATAKYAGTLGNKLKIVTAANPTETGSFDVSVFLDGSEVEYFEKVSKYSDVESGYVTFDKSSSAITATAGVSLSGGTDGENSTAGFAKMLDAVEKYHFDCMAVPTSDQSLITSVLSKIKYIRNSIGWKCTAVFANFAADYEAAYNLTNGFVYDGADVDALHATAWLAGAVAGADYTTSLTYTQVSGATGLVDEKNNEASIEAIKKGEIFFSVDEAGDIILEYDRNSKVTFTQDDPVDIYKGRPLRVYDTLANELLLTFVPNRFNNDSNGWDVMEGIGRSILKAYQNDGAIQNVDLENDFVIDRAQSKGESVYITVGIQPIDSAEKYYFTVISK